MTRPTHEPCPEHVDALDRMLAGEEPVPGLEAHIEECPACRRYVGRLGGLEAFLREAHDRFDEMEPGALAERRRPQPAKIAAWAAGFMIVSGLVAALALTRGPGRDEDPALAPGPVAELEEGRVILASGLPSRVLNPDGSSTSLELGSRIVAGSEILVPELGSLIVTFPSGVTLLVGSSSRILVEEATEERHVIRLEDGSIVVRADPLPGPGRLVVRSGETTVEQRGRVAAMRASRGVLAEVAAVSGSARVVPGKGDAVRVSEGIRLSALDGSTRPIGRELAGSLNLMDLIERSGFRSRLTVLSELPANVSLDGRSVGTTPLTVLLAEGHYSVSVFGGGSHVLHSEEVEVVYGRESLVVVEASMAALDADEAIDEEAVEETGEPGKPKLDIVARIRKALAEGDTDEALALVEKHMAKHSGSPSFMTAAADTYRKLGRHADAVDAYLAAATSGKDRTSEKAYLAAALLTLEKLRDPGRAQLILGAYWKAFPSGFYKHEAQFLDARLLVKQKKHAEARKRLEALLADGPDSYLATKAHLLLGSVLVTYLGDCKAALTHLKAVQNAAPGGKFAEEASRFMNLCNAP